MKKIFVAISMLMSSGLAHAALINGSTLSFAPINTGGAFESLPQDGLGSWFSMEIISDSPTITPISSLNGIKLGTTQLATPIPTAGNIDEIWRFIGQNGAHQSVSDTNVLSASGDTATVDFSGWGYTWNSITYVDISSGTWNGNAEGVANIVCDTGSGCGNGAGYILNYSATVPAGDPSGLGGVRYALHLEGTVSIVPVPAAVWLFGSGFIGLIGVARRKKV